MPAESEKLYYKLLERPDDTDLAYQWARQLQKERDKRGDFVMTQLRLSDRGVMDENHFRLVRSEQKTLALFRYAWAPMKCRAFGLGVRYRNGLPRLVSPAWRYTRRWVSTSDEDSVQTLGIKLSGTGELELGMRTGYARGEPVYQQLFKGQYTVRPDLTNEWLLGMLKIVRDKIGYELPFLLASETLQFITPRSTEGERYFDAADPMRWFRETFNAEITPVSEMMVQATKQLYYKRRANAAASAEERPLLAPSMPAQQQQRAQFRTGKSNVQNVRKPGRPILEAVDETVDVGEDFWDAMQADRPVLPDSPGSTTNDREIQL